MADGVRVSWSDNSSDEIAFNIYRKTVDPSGDYAKVGAVEANIMQYLDATADAGISYFYAVATQGVDGSSELVEQSGDPVNPGETSFVLSVSKSGDGAGTVTSSPAGVDCGTACSAVFDPGTNVTLTATPGADSVFREWGGACSGSSSTCDITITRDGSITATFDPDMIQVTSTSGGRGGRACTLRDAITAANEDRAVGGCRAGDGADVIILPTGQSITLTEIDHDGNGLPSVASEITMRGDDTTIERSSATTAKFRIVSVTSAGKLELRGVTLANGHGTSVGGAGIFNDGGHVALHASAIRGSRMDRTEVEGSRGGAIMNVAGTVMVTSSSLSDNYRSGSSEEHYEATSGGAILNVNGTLSVDETSISNNRSLKGGAIANVGADASAVVTKSQLIENQSQGIYNEGELQLVSTTLHRNYGPVDVPLPFGIENHGRLTMVDSRIEATSGTGLFSSGSASTATPRSATTRVTRIRSAGSTTRASWRSSIRR